MRRKEIPQMVGAMFKKVNAYTYLHHYLHTATMDKLCRVVKQCNASLVSNYFCSAIQTNTANTPCAE